jgi:hypothetical protein
VSSDKFLKCSKIEPKPTKEVVKPFINKVKNVLEKDSGFSEQNVRRIKNIYFTIIIASLFVLAYCLVKYLYKMYYIQRALKIAVPSNVLDRTRWDKWGKCSTLALRTEKPIAAPIQNRVSINKQHTTIRTEQLDRIPTKHIQTHNQPTNQPTNQHLHHRNPNDPLPQPRVVHVNNEIYSSISSPSRISSTMRINKK